MTRPAWRHLTLAALATAAAAALGWVALCWTCGRALGELAGHRRGAGAEL